MTRTKSFAFIAAVLTAARCTCADPPRPPPAPPSLADASFELAWKHEGFGEAYVVRAADLDGDGVDEVVVGGRGVAVLDARSLASHHPRLSFDWYGERGAITGGDNVWVTGMELSDLTGDGVADILVTSTDDDAYAFDGADGAALWMQPLESSVLSSGLVLFDPDQDGMMDFFALGSSTVFAGASGAPRWTLTTVGTPPHLAARAQLDGQPGDELWVANEPDEIVGGFAAEEDDAGATEEPVPAVFALAGDGRVTASFVPQGAVRALAAADLDGDGQDEALVGTDVGVIHALSGDGVELWQASLAIGEVVDLVATDADGDGSVEVYAAAWSYEEGRGRWVGLDVSGALRFTRIVDQPPRTVDAIDLDSDGTDEIVLECGTLGFVSSGLALAFDVDASGATQLWRREAGQAFLGGVLTNLLEGPALVLGNADSVLAGVDPMSGEERWRWVGGGFVFALGAGDLDGDGDDELVSGDEGGHLVVSHGRDGRERWGRTVAVGNNGIINSIDVGDFDGDGSAEVLAGGMRYLDHKQLGFVELLDGEGSALLSRVLDAEIWQVHLADLDGDGNRELLATYWTPAACGVLALSSVGDVLWRTDVGSCELPHSAVADMNGDGRPEVAVGVVSLSGPPWVALVQADGSLGWKRDIEDGTMWLLPLDGGFAHGGFASGFQGFVTRRGLDGETIWRALLPSYHGEGEPGRDGNARAATLVPDQNGDGELELAVSSDAGDVHLLSGESGATLWAARLEALDLPDLERHWAGPIAWVPGSASQPGYLAVVQAQTLRLQSKVFAVDLEGTVHGSVPTEGSGTAITVLRSADGSTRAAAAAGLSVYAVQAVLR